MRDTYNNAAFLYSDAKEFIGINLAADFTAEHEWGIAKLRAKFGCKTDKKGLPGTKITKDASISGTVVSGAEIWHYITSSKHIDNTSYFLKFCTQVDKTTNANIKVGWDESDFILMCDQEWQILQLKEMFKKKDIFISLGGGGVFENAGLVLVQASTMPKSVIEETINIAKSQEATKNRLSESKAFKLLEKKQKEWHKKYPFTHTTPWSYIALSPHGNGYWLNPEGQDSLPFGTFSLNDIEDWANEKTGAIIKNQKKWEERKYEMSLPLLTYYLKLKDSGYRKDFLNVPVTEYTNGGNWREKKIVLGKPVKNKGPFATISDESMRFLYAYIKHLILDDMFCQINIYTYDRYSVETRKEYFQKWIDEKPTSNLRARERVEQEITGVLHCLFLMNYGQYGACNVSERIGLRNLSYLKSVIEAEATYDFLNMCGMLHKNWK